MVGSALGVFFLIEVKEKEQRGTEVRIWKNVHRPVKQATKPAWAGVVVGAKTCETMHALDE